MNEEVSKQITLKPPVNKKLNEITKKRLAEGNPIHARQKVIAEYIDKGHRKECKNVNPKES